MSDRLYTLEQVRDAVACALGDRVSGDMVADWLTTNTHVGSTPAQVNDQSQMTSVVVPMASAVLLAANLVWHTIHPIVEPLSVQAATRYAEALNAAGLLTDYVDLDFGRVGEDPDA